MGTDEAEMKIRGQHLVPHGAASALSLAIWRENALGSHAFVRLPNEPFLRVATLSFPFGTAGGHAMLANSMPVISAGEVDVGEDGLVLRWSNMSGTYRPVRGSVGQSGLPIRKLWLWTSQGEIDAMDPIKRAFYMDQGLLIQTKDKDPGSAPSWHLHSSVDAEAQWNVEEEHVQPGDDMDHAEQLTFTPSPENERGNGATALLEQLVKEMNELSADKNRADNLTLQKRLFRKELGFSKTWKFNPDVRMGSSLDP